MTDLSPGVREIAEELILDAARSVAHSRIRTRIAGLAGSPTDEQWKQINVVEELVATATLTVEFRALAAQPEERTDG